MPVQINGVGYTDIVKQAMNEALSSSPDIDSVHEYHEQSVGEPVENLITLSGTGATSRNLFQVVGTVELMQMYGCVADSTSMANLTGAHWELYDSLAAVDLTKNDGVLSGMAVGTFFYKNATAAVTMAVNNNVVGAMSEAVTGVKAFTPFVITQKFGADTFIRFTYTTTTNPINAQLYFRMRFRPHVYDGVNRGTLVAV